MNICLKVINCSCTFVFQSALLALAAHTSNPAEADRLRHLASPAGKVCESYLLWHLHSPVLLRFPWMCIIFIALPCRMNMHNGWLQVREASLRSWLNFLQPSHHLVYSLQQWPHVCSPDTIQSHHLQGRGFCVWKNWFWLLVLFQVKIFFYVQKHSRSLHS